MNQLEQILHQRIAVAWHNTYRHDPLMYQRLICQWNNALNKQYGNKMRTMGVKPGVPDWQFLIFGGTIWIELKVGDGVQSPEQIKFESLCLHLGHEYHICRSYEAFWQILGIPVP